VSIVRSRPGCGSRGVPPRFGSGSETLLNYAGGRLRYPRTFAQFAHDELQKEQRGFGGLLILGKLPWMPFSSSPPKGGLVRMTSTATRSPMSVSLEAEELPGRSAGVRALQQQVHLAEEIRERLRSQPNRDFSAGLCGRPRSSPACEVIVRFDQEAAGCRCGVEDGFTRRGR